MKFTPAVLLLLACPFIGGAQDLTGVWRGNFYSGSGFYKQQYKYEIQIDQLPNKGLKGVTYSYRTTVFYGKAALQGIFMDKNKNVIIKETQMLEMKITDQSTPCLMTCYLDYYKVGKTEVLEGTFTSVNTNNEQDCGPGNVYLERVDESDFQKEDFLLNRKPPVVVPPQNINPPVIAKAKPDAGIKRLQTALGIASDGITGPHTAAVLKSKLPGFTGKITTGNADSLIAAISRINTTQTVKKSPPAVRKSVPGDPPVSKKIPETDTIAKSTPNIQTINPPVQQPVIKKPAPVPEIIKERENPLVKTIITSTPDIKVELFDNGYIDGDTITVYDNNEIIAYRKGLTAEPITINIKADTNNFHHEFIMVANNLGSIPPNTALMVITTGGKRYELFISEDEKKNAKVVIDYKAPGQ